jgi:hypothetical protein
LDVKADTDVDQRTGIRICVEMIRIENITLVGGSGTEIIIIAGSLAMVPALFIYRYLISFSHQQCCESGMFYPGSGSLNLSSRILGVKST